MPPGGSRSCSSPSRRPTSRRPRRCAATARSGRRCLAGALERREPWGVWGGRAVHRRCRRGAQASAGPSAEVPAAGARSLRPPGREEARRRHEPSTRCGRAWTGKVPRLPALARARPVVNRSRMRRFRPLRNRRAVLRYASFRLASSIRDTASRLPSGRPWNTVASPATACLRPSPIAVSRIDECKPLMQLSEPFGIVWPPVTTSRHRAWPRCSGRARGCT